MIRLERAQIAVLRPLFDTSILRLIGESMLAANTNGTAWVDDLSNPGLAVIHSGACVFVSGDPNRLETGETLGSLLLSDRTHVEAMRDEIIGGWGTEEAFLGRGFGFAVVGESAVRRERSCLRRRGGSSRSGTNTSRRCRRKRKVGRPGRTGCGSAAWR